MRSFLPLLLALTLSCSSQNDRGDCYEKRNLKACKAYCTRGDGKACATSCILTSDPLLCKKACNLKSRISCLKLRKIGTGEKPKKSKQPTRVELLQADCKKGEGDACLNLATIYEKGIGATKQVKGHFDKFDRFAKGEKVSFEKRRGGRDLKRAAQYAQSACKVGSQAGCTLLGTYYLKGVAVKRDTAMAQTLFTKACNRGSGQGCLELGRLLNTPKAKEHKRAQKLFRKSCTLGVNAGCLALATSLAASNDPKKRAEAIQQLKESCRGGVGEACSRLGSLYLKGTLVKRDLHQAEKFLHRACETRAEGACKAMRQFKKTYRSTSDTDSLEQMERACTKGNAEACATAGDLHAGGYYNIKQNRKKGRALLQKACKMKNSAACKKLKAFSTHYPKNSP